MYMIMDCARKKDTVSIAATTHTYLVEKVMNALKYTMPPGLHYKMDTMCMEMDVCNSIRRQHVEDNMRTNSPVSSHYFNLSLNFIAS